LLIINKILAYIVDYLYLCTRINKKHKKMARYRKQKEESLFEEELTIWALSELGNPLEDLEKLIDFEMFRPQLEDALQNKDCKTAAGRPPIDVVLIFKVLFLQRYYGLGDHQIEYQITDRVSFRKFLGIRTLDDIPDEKTVWHYRNLLSQKGTFDKLFDEFRSFLDAMGLRFDEGKIIDATFVEAPKQHNTPDENKKIKEGEGDSLWNAEEGDTAEEKARKKHKVSCVQHLQVHPNLQVPAKTYQCNQGITMPFCEIFNKKCKN